MSAICGILGASPEAAATGTIESMLESMKHRGPDATHVWMNGGRSAAIGYADLHAFAADGDVNAAFADTDDIVVAIDGTVTNRADLLGGDGTRDGEAHLHDDARAALTAHRRHGDACPAAMDGPFTMALYDRARATLLLTRDKLGERSMYYYVDPGSRVLVFASEIKAILEHPAVSAELDRHSLSIYLSFGYIPGERTLFTNIRKLLPGESLSFSAGRKPEITRYWHLPRISDGLDDEAACVKRMGELFNQALERYVNGADRVGVFLSGGVDSSIIVAGLREIGVKRIGTFTVGFNADPSATKEEDLGYARMVARRFDTEHHEVILGPEHDPRSGLLAVIRQLDDLIMTPNTYSKHVLACAARDAGFNSILTGSAAAGACGVHRKFLNPKKRAKLLRKTEACATDEERFYELRGRLFDLDTQAAILTQAPTITTQDILDVLGAYIRYVDSDDFFRLFLFSNLAVTSAEKTLRVLENVGAMSGVDIRSPYLDRELVEFSTRLPSSFDGGKSYATLKTHMKKAYETTIPREVLDRKVIGYPSYYWNNGELDEYQHRVFGRDHIERTGLFDHATVNKLIEDEKSEEKKSAGKYAWALTQFSLWYEERFGPEPRLAKAV